MIYETDYDCAVIGGGVAGLALAVLLAKDNRKVILFEKESYPFHKVCGEYISNESAEFIGGLGVDLANHAATQINSLLLSSVSGVSVKRNLSIGGMGLSRYKLDHLLYQTALAGGATVKMNTKIQRVEFEKDFFRLRFGDRQITAKTVCGAYGKNSNIDAQLNRIVRADDERNLFVAVKRHIKIEYDRTQVELHNFSGGYCGLSAIEDDRVNMSYITRARNLRNCGGKIPELEKRILAANPFLKRYVCEAKFELEKPLVIAHLHFGIKTAADAGILMLGDAAGNIAPLSGNGMSMALRSAAIARRAVNRFLDGQTSRAAMEKIYAAEYKRSFSARIFYARLIHRTLISNRFLNDLNFYFLKTFPFLVDFAQGKIHGSEF